VIEAVSSTGSFLDGGGSRPLQRAAVPLLHPDHVRAETNAIREAFGAKRRLCPASSSTSIPASGDLAARVDFVATRGLVSVRKPT